jgi:hypothetical protein
MNSNTSIPLIEIDTKSIDFFQYTHASVAGYAIAFFMEGYYPAKSILEAWNPDDAVFIRNQKFLNSLGDNGKISGARWDEDVNDFVAPFVEWFSFLHSIVYPLKQAMQEWCNDRYGSKKSVVEKRSPDQIKLDAILEALGLVFPSISYKDYARFPLVLDLNKTLNLDENQVESRAKRLSKIPKPLGRPPKEKIQQLKITMSHLDGWLNEIYPEESIQNQDLSKSRD